MNVTDLGVFIEWRLAATVALVPVLTFGIWLALFVGARIGAGRDD